MGLKYDEGKKRWDLLPLSLIEKVVDVYTFGATKYEPNTWQNLKDGYDRYKAAMFRHLVAHEKGEIIDPESGLLHLAHVAWNALALLHFNKERTMEKEKINVAELLQDCPKGMELYSPIYGLGILTKVTDRIHVKFPKEHNVKCFRPDGKVSEDGEIMLYPKGKTTWEGFVPSCKFKVGDVVAFDTKKGVQLFIFKEYLFNRDSVQCYMMLDWDGKIDFDGGDYYAERLATEEEKQKLFDAIKANGYKWNAETKKLEKLQKEKFDITTLKPFESRVLVRNDEHQYWIPALWGIKRIDGYTTTFGWGKYCIPYEGNEHLLGTTDDCDEYYKTWEEWKV